MPDLVLPGYVTALASCLLSALGCALGAYLKLQMARRDHALYDLVRERAAHRQLFELVAEGTVEFRSTRRPPPRPLPLAYHASGQAGGTGTGTAAHRKAETLAPDRTLVQLVLAYRDITERVG
jgi:hypothetical protein